MNEKNLNLNFLALVGYAGQGKDTVKNVLLKNYKDTTFFNLTFAQSMKEQVADILSEDLISLTGEKSKFNALNILKDDFTNIRIFKNYNTREFLQKLGTEFYRELDPDIHVRFCAKEILKNLIENKDLENYMYVSSDTRFPNELDFILKMGQLKDKELEIDYLKYYLKNSKNLPSFIDFERHFHKIFEITNEDKKNDFLNKIIDRMYIDVSELKEDYFPKKDWSNLKVPNTYNMNIKEALDFGVFHVFRPIIKDNKLEEKDLFDEIKNYTGLSEDKVSNIKDCYEKYGIGFNIENVSKYGFVRADITHYSEIALNDRKPIPFISFPCKNESDFSLLNNKILKLFESNEIKKKNKYKI